MKLYWPMATLITVTGPGEARKERAFTYDACTSPEKALQQIAFWEDDRHIIRRAWIDVYEDGKQTGRLEVEKAWKVKEE